MRLGFFLLVLFPITELMILIKVGGMIGVLPTLAIIFATASAGLYLMRREGFSTLARAQQRMAAGEIPATEMMEGLVIAFCGALLLAPGFLTDAFALLVLIPQVRRALINWAVKSGKINSVASGGIYGFTGTGGFQPGAGNHRSRYTNAYYENGRDASANNSTTNTNTNRSGVIEGEFRRED